MRTTPSDAAATRRREHDEIEAPQKQDATTEPKPPAWAPHRTAASLGLVVERRSSTAQWLSRQQMPAKTTDRGAIEHALGNQLGVPLVEAPARHVRHSDAARIQAELTRQSAPPKRLPPPPPPPVRLPTRAAPAVTGPTAPVAVRFEAQRRIELLDDRHARLLDRAETALARAERDAARTLARDRQEMARGQFREGVDSTWTAERDVKAARDALVEVKTRYRAARHELEVLLGVHDQAAIKQGRPGETRATLQIFEQRLAQYEKSVANLRSSALLGPLLLTAAVLGREAKGASVDDAARRRLDGYVQLGNFVEGGLGLAAERKSQPFSGAAAPAPGVDHRGFAHDTMRAHTFAANRPPAAHITPHKEPSR